MRVTGRQRKDLEQRQEVRDSRGTKAFATVLRSKLARLLFNAPLIFLILHPASSSLSDETRDAQQVTSTYMAAVIGENQEVLVEYVNYKNVTTGGDVSLAGNLFRHRIENTTVRDELILLQVEPGNYYLREIRPFSSIFSLDDKSPIIFNEPKRKVSILPGAITYIGRIEMSVRRKTRDIRQSGGLLINYEYKYSEKDILKAATRYREYFDNYQVYLAIPGEKPILVDVDGMKEAQGLLSP